MRDTEFASIDLDQLLGVTGGCKKKCPPPPPPPQQAAPQPSSSGVDVTVATGAQAAQLMQGSAG